MSGRGKQIAVFAVGFGCVLAISGILLGDTDSFLVWKWWAFSVLMGLGTWPLTGRLLASMADGGYFFSKICGIAAGGLLTWLLCYLGVPFTGISCLVITLFLFVLCWGTAWLLTDRKKAARKKTGMLPVFTSLNLLEELLFIALFVFWMYMVGFKPAAYGTEKMMDYGFMASMMRSTSLPVKDMWYSDGIINYYYGGQYYVVYMTKLFFTDLKNAYNLFRAFLPAAAFVMAFGIAYTLFERTICAGETVKDRAVCALGSMLAGISLTFAGNGHWIVFAKIVPMLQQILGIEVSTYWFSDSTRYIGYVPDVPDKTIHEYPSYSFLLGDLHAHVINILFVLLFVAILMSWCFRQKDRHMAESAFSDRRRWFQEIFQPEIIALSVLAGVFKWTNFWDFAIYFGAAGIVILAVNLRKYAGSAQKIFLITVLQAGLALAVSSLVILPFTLDFDTMFQGFALAQNHSLFYQLVILWGIPVSAGLVFVLSLCRNAGKEKRVLPMEDQFIVIMIVYAVILVLVPEIVYVKDIYYASYARSNTMFKFTYQAYMLFAIFASYGIVRMTAAAGENKSGIRKFGWVMLLLLVLTVGYFPDAADMWLGDLAKTQNYRGSDATAFLETDQEFAQDVAAIHWLEENVEGSPVVLEADGSSYTKANIVSAMTGLPTVMGWYTHEWLWRNDPDDLNVRIADIKTIYTSDDPEEVKRLIGQYQVSYIYIGSNEYEKYGTVNTQTLDQLGDVVFTGESTGDKPATLIYRVNR